MNKMTNALVMVLGFGLLVVALGVLTSKPVPAETEVRPASVPVTVKNTIAQPVPTSAQGTTAIVGNVKASITNAVSLAPGTVTNTKTTPLFVNDVDAAGRYPFAVSGLNIGGSTYGAALTLPNTPSGGGTAVIEFASAICDERQIPFPDFHYLLYFLGGNQSRVILTGAGNGIVNPAQTPPFNTNEWVGQQTKIYADPGSSVQLLQQHDNGGCDLWLSGYLIPQ